VPEISFTGKPNSRPVLSKDLSASDSGYKFRIELTTALVKGEAAELAV
jgi:hypothetical protein